MAIAILGRPNVGKSSVFNALIGKPQSLVWNKPGVTRDRVRAHFELDNGESFELWDFAGWEAESHSSFRSFPLDAWKDQIELILFVVDASVELTAMDLELAQRIRRLNLPVLLVFNKSDKKTFLPERVAENHVFKSWPAVNLSAEQKEGLLDLKEFVRDMHRRKDFKKINSPEAHKRVLILGRPNVGKSSLMNRLAGTDISFVSDQAGTTRDLVEFDKKIDGHTWQFLDSAGVRKKGKIYGRHAEPVEIFSVYKALQELKKIDLCILLVDPHKRALFHTQDKKLLKLVAESKVPCLIVVNKWDTMRDLYSQAQYKLQLQWDMGSFAYLPLRLISAKTGFQVKSMLRDLESIDKRFKKLKTSELNKWLVQVQTEKQPRVAKRGQKSPGCRTQNQYLRYFYMVQTSERPLRFQIFCNAPQAVAKDEKRFLERRLRETYQFEGLPIEFFFKKKAS